MGTVGGRSTELGIESGDQADPLIVTGTVHSLYLGG